MVEVVGTAPTSAMFITKFVYRHSWKSNTNNIKLYFKDSIYLLNDTSEQQKKEIAEQQSQKNTTKELHLLNWKKYFMKPYPCFRSWFCKSG